MGFGLSGERFLLEVGTQKMEQKITRESHSREGERDGNIYVKGNKIFLPG